MRHHHARARASRADVREEFAGHLPRTHRLSIDRGDSNSALRRRDANRLNMPLSLTITAESGKTYAPFLRRHVRAAFRLLPKCNLRELDIALVGAKRMKQLHQE